MSDQTGTTTIVVETPDGSPATVTLDNETGSPVEATEPETPSNDGESDAVEIERIRSETQITTAAINAETESERIAANVEIEKDASWLRAELASSQEQNRLLREELDRAQSIPLPSSVEVVEELETINPETTMTILSETETEPSNSTETEAAAESPVEKAAEILEQIAATPNPALVKRRVRMI